MGGCRELELFLFFKACGLGFLGCFFLCEICQKKKKKLQFKLIPTQTNHKIVMFPAARGQCSAQFTLYRILWWQGQKDYLSSNRKKQSMQRKQEFAEVILSNKKLLLYDFQL